MTEQQEVQPSAAAPVADNNKPGQKAPAGKKGGAGVKSRWHHCNPAGPRLTGGLYLHGHKNAVAQQGELAPQAATGRGSWASWSRIAARMPEQFSAPPARASNSSRRRWRPAAPCCWIRRQAPQRPDAGRIREYLVRMAGRAVARTRYRLRHHPARQCRRANQGAQRSQPDAHSRRWRKTSPSFKGMLRVDREG